MSETDDGLNMWKEGQESNTMVLEHLAMPVMGREDGKGGTGEGGVGWGDDELSSEHIKFVKPMDHPRRDESNLAVCVNCHKNVSTSRHLF